jgi:hypothetical protein
MYKLKEGVEEFCSDLLVSHQMKCECALAAWQHGDFLVAER